MYQWANPEKTSLYRTLNGIVTVIPASNDNSLYREIMASKAKIKAYVAPPPPPPVDKRALVEKRIGISLVELKSMLNEIQ